MRASSPEEFDHDDSRSDHFIESHSLESVDEDAMCHGSEDPVFDVREYDEILATYVDARRMLYDMRLVVAVVDSNAVLSPSKPSVKPGGKKGRGNLSKRPRSWPNPLSPWFWMPKAPRTGLKRNVKWLSPSLERVPAKWPDDSLDQGLSVPKCITSGGV